MRPSRTMLVRSAPFIAAAMLLLLWPGGSPRDAHIEFWRSGDIVLLNGNSIRSRAVRLLQGYSSDYSHVGIVVVQQRNVFVIHADPVVDRVVEQPWAEMLAAKEYSGGALYRLREDRGDTARSVCASAMHWARERVPFDHQFDLNTPDRLYCTELVWRAYRAAGVDLMNGSGRKHRYLLPARLVESPQLCCVLRF